MKLRYELYQRSALISMRAFFVFGPKIFSSISISGGRSGEKEVSAVTTHYTEQYVKIFVFRSLKFNFNISKSGGRRGEREVSAVQRGGTLISVRVFFLV